MYAVFKLGGNQHRAAVGDVFTVEKLDVEEGQTIEIGDVMMVNTGSEVLVGQPFVRGAMVKGEVVRQERGKKILVIKYKRRNKYRRKVGHRQPATRVRVTEVVLG